MKNKPMINYIYYIERDSEHIVRKTIELYRLSIINQLNESIEADTKTVKQMEEVANELQKLITNIKSHIDSYEDYRDQAKLFT